MNIHDQPELLSAYLDGQATPDERAALDAHVPACAECTQTLDALRATVTEMRALPELDPAALKPYALRATIARARGRTWRTARWSAALAGGAASVVAIVALIASGGGNGKTFSAGPNAALESAPSVEVDPANYDAKSAQALLVNEINLLSGTSKAVRAPTAAVPEVARDEFGAMKDSVDTMTRSSVSPKAGECETQALAGEDSPHARLRAIAATYDKAPAFLFVFRFTPPKEPARLELWVLRQSDCTVLYFAQREE